MQAVIPKLFHTEASILKGHILASISRHDNSVDNDLVICNFKKISRGSLCNISLRHTQRLDNALFALGD